MGRLYDGEYKQLFDRVSSLLVGSAQTSANGRVWRPDLCVVTNRPHHHRYERCGTLQITTCISEKALIHHKQIQVPRAQLGLKAIYARGSMLPIFRSACK